MKIWRVVAIYSKEDRPIYIINGENFNKNKKEKNKSKSKFEGEEIKEYRKLKEKINKNLNYVVNILEWVP